MAEKDYYGILGVEKTASADDIKSAYRRLAKKYHPDIYATAPEAERKSAEEKFKEIQHAYEVLSDPQKKAAYDQYGSEDGPSMGGGSGFNPFGGGAGFGDFFSDIINQFSGGGRSGSGRYAQRDGDDIEVGINLTFKEACFGVTDKEINYVRYEQCSSCGGTGGARPDSVCTCSKCKGSGRIRYQRTTIFGQSIQESVCDACGGRGKTITEKCRECGGKGRIRKQVTKKVNIPAGIDNGQMMTVRGAGCAPEGADGSYGNLTIVFKVAPHPLFIREGINLSYEYPITALQAALGDTVSVPTLNGFFDLKIPEGSQNGDVMRVKGKGVKDLRRDSYGDLFIHLIIDVPKGLNRKQRDALEEAQRALEKARYDKIDKFNKKLRDL